MTYEETLAYIYEKLPMYQRIGSSAFKKDLTNIIALCDVLGNPQDQFKSIHVAGTNGKGSTSHILSAIYQHNGYKVGLYTSPHLLDFRERIKLNGELCPKEFVTGFVNRLKNEIEEIQPSFFEITVAMAFSYFAEQKIDVAIIETGLGGRLDSTNIIKPLACIITSIGYDHKDMLGDTLELIAGEKAGIIKRGIPVVTGNIAESPLQVICKKAKTVDASVYPFIVNEYDTDLVGVHQQWNIGAAMKCIELVKTILPVEYSESINALKHIRTTSNFLGRWQVLNASPIMVICDVGHNEEGFRLIARQLEDLGLEVYYILGFVKGKELNEIAPLLPLGNEYHFVKPDVVRGMPADEALAKFELPIDVYVKSHPSLLNAIEKAYSSTNRSEKKAAIFIGGSNFLVADLLHLEQQGKLPWKS